MHFEGVTGGDLVVADRSRVSKGTKASPAPTASLMKPEKLWSDLAWLLANKGDQGTIVAHPRSTRWRAWLAAVNVAVILRPGGDHSYNLLSCRYLSRNDSDRPFSRDGAAGCAVTLGGLHDLGYMD